MKKMERTMALGQISLRLTARNRSRLASKIITVILSAFSFMLFALASLGYLYSETGFVTRAYWNYSRDREYLTFFAAMQPPPADCIPYFEEHITLPAVSAAGRRFSNWDLFLNTEPDFSRGDRSEQTLSGSGDDYAAIGFSLLAGRYPEGENEIAVSEYHYQQFLEYGFRDVSAYFSQSEQYDGNISNYAVDREALEEALLAGEIVGEEISDYNDLIGKHIAYDDPAHGGQYAVSYEIVGIVDTGYSENINIYSSSFYYDPAGYFMYSDAWKTYLPGSIFLASPRTMQEMRACVEVAIEFYERNESIGLRAYLDLEDISALMRSNDFTNEVIIAAVGGALGVFFGIFAVLLNGHLTARSLEDRRRQFGILRSLGAGDGDIRKIVITEVLLTATGIFLLALAGSLAVYFGFLRPFFLWPRGWGEHAVSLLVYNGWTVLILALLCYSVPLLCSIPAMRKFCKLSAIECIQGSPPAARGKKRR